MRAAEFWLNILVYYMFFGLLYLIFNSRRVSATMGSILWCIIGIANYYVLSFKGAPIVPSDIMSARTAANVAENYTYSIQPVFVWNVLFLLLYLAIMWRCPVPKKIGLEKAGNYAYCYRPARFSARTFCRRTKNIKELWH